MIRRTIYETLVVLFFSIALAAVVYAFRSDRLPLTAARTSQEENSQSGQLYKIIPMEQAQRIFNQKLGTFADARPFEAYREAHIQGAVHLDPTEFDIWSQAVVEKYSPEHIFVTYCHGPNCPLARELAEKLTWLGFETVYYVRDGWGQWQSLGLPSAVGD